MTSDAEADHIRIKQLFNAVCDEPDAAAQRQALQALGADEASINRVLALLRQDRGPTRISTPVAKAAAQIGELKSGDRLGAWKLISELGHGGMGRVFLAERCDGHYQQTAAIKLLLGWSGPDELIRLAHERQILASLNHPNIARLLDGGTTPRGRPYLVMEHVDGEPIDSHSASAGLSLTARLNLFLSVCDAVAHAHQQLVIHCDIKPSNVLVNRDGRALLLDFGIAQLEGQALALHQDGAPTLSQAMTPRYASPEQQLGGTPSTTWDVFGLGRLLEDLVEPLHGRDLCSRELRAIINRACADEPQARYASVAELQADLRNLRLQQPVRAMPQDLAYRLRKLLRRRRASALTIIAVVIGSVAFTVRLVHERDRAEQEAATTREVSAFVTSLFTGADPSRSGRPDVSAAELLDQGRERLARDLQDRPPQRATLLAVLGDVYEKIGRLETSAEVLEEVAALESAAGLARPLREADALARLAVVLSNSNQYRRAEAPARRAVELLEARLPDDDLRLIDARNRLAVALTGLGELAAAEQLLVKVLSQRRQALGAEHLDTLTALHNLARVHHAQGRLDEAVAELHEALAIKRRVYGVRNDNALTTIEELAKVLSTQRNYQQSEALLREALAIRTELFGPRSELLAKARNELAAVLQDSGRVDAAIGQYREVLDCMKLPRCQSDHLQSVALNNLGTALEQVGRLPEAETALRQSLEIRATIYAPDDPAFARAQANLARVLLAMRRIDQAAPLVDAAWQTRAERLPPDHVERIASQLQRGELALLRKDLAAARQALDEASAQLVPNSPASALAGVAELRAGLAMAEHGPATALPDLQAAWAARAAQFRTDRHPAMLKSGLALHAAYLASNRTDDAENLGQLLRDAAAQHGPDSPWRRRLEQGG